MNGRLPAMAMAMAMGMAWLLGASLLAPAALGEELSARELRKLKKQAGKAFGSGQFEPAAEAYQRILDGTDPGASQRADALYAVAMYYLSPERRDEEKARAHLAELAASFPSHPRRLEIAAAQSSLAQLDDARTALRVAAARLAAHEATLEKKRQQAAAEQQEQEEQSAATGGKVRSLEAQLRKARSELDETRAELARKDEALEKLKDALVGRAGGSTP